MILKARRPLMNANGFGLFVPPRLSMGLFCLSVGLRKKNLLTDFHKTKWEQWDMGQEEEAVKSSDRSDKRADPRSFNGFYGILIFLPISRE